MLLTWGMGVLKKLPCGLRPENRENREKLHKDEIDPTVAHEIVPKPKAHKRQAHPSSMFCALRCTWLIQVTNVTSGFPL